MYACVYVRSNVCIYVCMYVLMFQNFRDRDEETKQRPTQGNNYEPQMIDRKKVYAEGRKDGSAEGRENEQRGAYGGGCR